MSSIVKWDIEKINQFVKDNSDCILLSTECENTLEKLDFICDCGNEFSASFAKFLHRDKRQCNACGHNNISKNSTVKLQHEDVRREVERDGCKLLSEYQNNTSKLSVMCTCGHVFNTDYKCIMVKKFRYCNECSMDMYRKERGATYKIPYVPVSDEERAKNKETRRLKTENKLKEYLKHDRHGEFELLGNYIDNKTKVLLLHKACGYEWNVRRGNFIFNKQRCPNCSGFKNTRYTQQEIKDKIYDTVGDEYSLLGLYTGGKNKTLIRHNQCGHEWGVSMGHFFHSGSRCPRCAMSKGEEKVRQHLVEKSVNFKEEYTFDDCRDIGLLRFDFAIIQKSTLSMLIEYDGEQHYEGWRGKGESLENIQRRDNIKNQYCKDNNIPLLRIPYWEFDNIESILEKHL